MNQCSSEVMSICEVTAIGGMNFRPLVINSCISLILITATGLVLRWTTAEEWELIYDWDEDYYKMKVVMCLICYMFLVCHLYVKIVTVTILFETESYTLQANFGLDNKGEKMELSMGKFITYIVLGLLSPFWTIFCCIKYPMEKLFCVKKKTDYHSFLKCFFYMVDFWQVILLFPLGTITICIQTHPVAMFLNMVCVEAFACMDHTVAELVMRAYDTALDNAHAYFVWKKVLLDARAVHDAHCWGGEDFDNFFNRLNNQVKRVTEMQMVNLDDMKNSASNFSKRTLDLVKNPGQKI